tara:strand:- start:6912 stop:7355 length:444 start_codon:yes stop_codon:yes gene_type:complete
MERNYKWNQPEEASLTMAELMILCELQRRGSLGASCEDLEDSIRWLSFSGRIEETVGGWESIGGWGFEVQKLYMSLEERGWATTAKEHYRPMISNPETQRAYFAQLEFLKKHYSNRERFFISELGRLVLFKQLERLGEIEEMMGEET